MEVGRGDNGRDNYGPGTQFPRGSEKKLFLLGYEAVKQEQKGHQGVLRGKCVK